MLSGWADAIEALIRIGELDLAADHLDRWSPVVWTRLARIGLLRCTGLLADARGEPQAAAEVLERAVAADNPRTYPFERARTLLALGAARRHALQRRAARSTLQEALVVFEQLGAAPWADRVTDELKRISGRRPSGELTEAESACRHPRRDGEPQQRDRHDPRDRGRDRRGTPLTRLSQARARSRAELSGHLSEAGDETPKV